MAVRVEPFAPVHAEALQTLASDARIAATTLVPHPYPRDGAATFIAASEEARAAREAFGFAVLDGDALVGSCGIKHLDWEARTGEVGYWIGVLFWGHGHATGAVRLVTAFGVVDLGLRRVEAEVLATNPASGACWRRRGTAGAGPSPTRTAATRARPPGATASMPPRRASRSPG